MTQEQEQIVLYMLSHLHQSVGWHERIPEQTGLYYCRYCLGGGETEHTVHHQQQCMIVFSKLLAQTLEGVVDEG